METAHLASLGARPIPRADFSALLERLVAAGPAPGRWRPDGIADAWPREAHGSPA